MFLQLSPIGFTQDKCICLEGNVCERDGAEEPVQSAY